MHWWQILPFKTEPKEANKLLTYPFYFIAWWLEHTPRRRPRLRSLQWAWGNSKKPLQDTQLKINWGTSPVHSWYWGHGAEHKGTGEPSRPDRQRAPISWLPGAPRCQHVSPVPPHLPPWCVPRIAYFHMFLYYFKECFKWSKTHHLGAKIRIQASPLLHKWLAQQAGIPSWFAFCTHVSNSHQHSSPASTG